MRNVLSSLEYALAPSRDAKSRRMRTCKNTVLYLPQNAHLQKKGRGVAVTVCAFLRSSCDRSFAPCQHATSLSSCCSALFHEKDRGGGTPCRQSCFRALSAPLTSFITSAHQTGHAARLRSLHVSTVDCQLSTAGLM